MPRIPSYRKQRSKSGDRALVEFGGVRTYLGEYNSPESRELYGRKLADWEATGGHLPAPCDDLTVNELTARYWSFAESYYVKDGEPTGELRWIKSALKPLVGLYGSLPAGEFTPLKLTAIRNQMIADGLARKPISNRIGNLKRMFKWAVVNELVSPGPAKACGRWPGPTRRKPAAVQSAGGFQACSPSCLGYEV